MRNPPVKARLHVARANFFEQRATGSAKAYARHMRTPRSKARGGSCLQRNRIQPEPARFNCITIDSSPIEAPPSTCRV